MVDAYATLCDKEDMGAFGQFVKKLISNPIKTQHNTTHPESFDFI